MNKGGPAHETCAGPRSLLKKPNLRCQLRDGKGYHLRTSKLNPLPPLLPSISDFLNRLSVCL
jgi:hypothetical protein